MATRTERLEMRLSPEERSLLERAAAAAGMPLGTLVRNLLMERVQEVLDRESRSTLPLAQLDAFLEMLDGPSEPPTRLVEAARKHAERRGRR